MNDKDLKSEVNSLSRLYRIWKSASKRLCHNPSSRPSPVDRSASRDSDVSEMIPLSYIPDLAMLSFARLE
jgi:hypothetical protein